MSIYTTDEDGQIFISPPELDNFEYYRDNIFVRTYEEFLTLNPYEYEEEYLWELYYESISGFSTFVKYGYKVNETPELEFNRFMHNIENVTIPQGATIETAVFKVLSYSTYLDEIMDVWIGFQNTPDAPLPYTLGIEGMRTVFETGMTSIVNWALTSSEPWSASSWYSSPSIVTPLQEIINLGSWSSGNSLNLIVDPKLNIETIKQTPADNFRYVMGHPTGINELIVTWSNPTGSDTFLVNTTGSYSYLLYQWWISL
jgi:hypothetical protein